MSIVFTFASNEAGLPDMKDAAKLREFGRAISHLPKGPLHVSLAVREAASAQLAELARERAVRFARETPSPADFTAVAEENRELLRLWAGTVVSDRVAEVA
ncbi:MAG TPA: hypothetical protein P5528_17120 [Steroidobacteraceae bacterium]|nr:hypothetical protein [Steroidobacteraceae bacterium]